ncbi:MAG: YitT family protein, partial [Erysipelotrichaceae bacterium]|nr:YitT family protein [Erysipelotrichaceae bacterium]
ILQAQGGYSGRQRPVLLCVVSQRQYSRLLQIVHEVDKRAFIITTDASDMHGEGFTFPSPSARM